MIKFDHSKLQVTYRYVKAATTAIGGSISTVASADENLTLSDSTRVTVPLAIVRSFIKRVGHSKFIKPLLVAVVEYDGHVVSLEHHPLGCMGELVTKYHEVIHTWVPNCVNHIAKLNVSTGSGSWFFDGRYVYSFASLPTADNIERASGRPLCSSGQFFALRVTSFDLQDLYTKEAFGRPSDRDCIAFKSSRNDLVVSPPIWTSIRDIGSGTSGSEESEDSGRQMDEALDTYYFDRVDATKTVNVSFSLKAGQVLGNMFGYDLLSPLNLPELMVQLNTVNLPSLPPQLKNTYPAGLKFSHAFAWLLGLINRANTLDTYVAMRSLIKYLGTRGIYERKRVQANDIYVNQQGVNELPSVDLVAEFAKRGSSLVINNLLIDSMPR